MAVNTGPGASLDLRLLVVFDAVIRKNSLTAAGDSLGMSQPLMSQSLARLRQYFGDPLFVRTSGGMAPTPRARELAPKIGAMIQLMQEALESSGDFDPATSERTFSFASTDFGAAYLMPKLLQHLAKHAPNIRVRATHAPRHGVEDMLEEGEVDLAVGSFAINRLPFYQRRLYDSDYVCLARREHPTIQGTLTRETYLAAKHALVAPLPSGYEALERFLLENVSAANFAVIVPNFLTVLTTLPNSNALFTVTRRAGEQVAQLLGAQMLGLPVDIPGFTVRQFWHERFHKDPANKWFRDLIYTLLADPGETLGEGGRTAPDSQTPAP
ncbi:bacterial regulatory helix-turn-helix, lysR family protein [Burkholderia cenocepacia]|uniref:Bacterial regulatory helix-turn-helix, lysR family protein n=1 Tax=Burkholderia cenocepacia TaxID=95486 RepID=A0AAN0RWX8_9BURK|nr:bacterial regulatory helix-turn-helix, lysR family protein [Burkholderia cenocepacia]